MHKRKIRPKLFFYFLDSVLKNSKNLKKEFEAFKIVITGKLMGGTARTRSFSVGFGNFPIQSFDCNIRYEMGQLKSKYGSFGIKIFT
jgi:ribosomal protein S3